jgi:hypothetical protein
VEHDTGATEHEAADEAAGVMQRHGLLPESNGKKEPAA